MTNTQIVLALVGVVALAVVIALGYFGFLALRERRSMNRSLPSGMKSNPNRFRHFDDDDEHE